MVGIKTKRLESALSLGAFAILAVLGLRYIVSNRSGMVYDVLISMAALIVFSKLYNKLHQDSVSYFFFIFALILHNLGLYGTKPLGVSFDHYMHFVGGFAIAIITDRAFTEKLSKMKRFAMLVIFTIGIGAIGEIIEWLGYALLGSGEGFLLYGSGDEGEWRNLIFDMIFNALGAATMAVFAAYESNRLMQMIKYKKEVPTKS